MKKSMKRCEFQLSTKDHEAVSLLVNGGTFTFSDFLRFAVAEKLAREQGLSQMEKATEKLNQMVGEMRQEFGRTRKDLMEDSQRGLELMRLDIGKSMKKNEEINKTFLMLLGGHAAPPSPQKPRETAEDDDAPMRVPG